MNIDKSVKIALTLALIITLIGCSIAIAINFFAFDVPSNGDINTSPNIIVNPNYLDFGNFSGGESVDRIITVTNTGNAPLTLTMTTTIPSYLTLTWDAENYILAIGESKDVTFTCLSATDAPAGDFSGITTITGTV